MTEYVHTACRALFVLLLLFVAGAALPAPVLAQSSLGGGFGGFSSAKNNQPIDIESDTLEVQDNKKIAIFKGNVKAVQGDMTLRSKELHVSYASAEGKDGAPAGGLGSGGGGSQITRIRAEGKVIIDSAKDQTATSEWADFDVLGQIVTIGGNVILSQGGNVIKGDRLVIDLKTGQSRFENQTTDGKQPRVKGLFMPKQSDKEGAEGGATGQGQWQAQTKPPQ
ncbi:MAG: LptA/OstA family protein [Pseudomonadota bacterium]|nr:LptA/OstA family protein [Pseudomonadota bacterium]